MSKRAMVRWIGVGLLGCAWAMQAAAQDSFDEASTGNVSTSKQESATKALRPGEYRASSLLEMRVKNAQNEDLGVISELLIDKQGRVSHVVLQEGGLLGMGEHRYAVPWNRVKIGTDGKVALIDVSKERLATEFSAFEPEEIPREPLR